MYNILLTGAVAEDLDIVGHPYCFPFFFWEQVFLRSLCEKYSPLFLLVRSCMVTQEELKEIAYINSTSYQVTSPAFLVSWRSF